MMGSMETTGARAQALMKLARAIVKTAEVGDEYSADAIATKLDEIGADRKALDGYVAAYEDNFVWDYNAGAQSTREWEDEVIVALNAERAATERTNEALSRLDEDPAADWRALAAVTGIPEDALRTRAGKPRTSLLDSPGTVTVAQAARLLNTPRTTVNHWVKTGRLKTTEVRGRTVVLVDAEGQPLLLD